MSTASRTASELAALRDALAERVKPLELQHAERLQCRRGCHACCIDGLSVFEVEAEAIREAFPELLRSGKPHPSGACAFLEPDPRSPAEVGTCRIYAARPYVCRTQGLPLRWVEDEAAGIERRDICPLNEEGTPLEELGADECFTLGPFEGRLAQLQATAQHESERAVQPGRGASVGELRRVSLRSLFDD